VQYIITLKVWYDINCVESAIKLQQTNPLFAPCANDVTVFWMRTVKHEVIGLNVKFCLFLL